MFGLRADGKKVKGLDPIQKMMPHIMSARHDSQNLCKYEVPCSGFDRFIKEQRDKGFNFNYMHLTIAGLVRTIAMYPRLNRFVMNGRIYHRNAIYVSFIVKKNLSATAADANVKLKLTGQENIYEIKDMIDNAIKATSNLKSNNNTDKLARTLSCVPNGLIKFGTFLLKFFDKHGLLPMKILDASPFHTTLFVTNLKSIKGEYIYHHVYDFGTTGLFASMGKEKTVPGFDDDGNVVPFKYMPLGIVTDERFCDGFYFVSSLKTLKKLYLEPELLCDRLEELPQDVEVFDPNSRINKKKAKKAMKNQIVKEDNNESEDSNE